MAGNGLSERLQFPISTAELERRWGLVRAAMKREGVDVLLMQNNNDHMGGYVKYFTDMPATNGYPNTVVFPADDEMTVVCQGPFNGDSRPPADIWRGVKRMLTTPSYESAHYTQYYDPELAAKALQPYAKATIGFVGIYQMSFAMGDFIMKKFPSAKFVDASELVDRIKVIKSAEELELVRRCRHHAGRRDEGGLRRDQARHARHRGGRGRGALQPGCRAARTASISAPRRRPARPAKFGQRHVQNRTIKKGDTLRAAGRGFRPGRHVHRARPLLRARQGAAADEGRARDGEGVAQAHPRHAQARHALQGHLGGVQRLHAQARPARGGAALLPRPGLRPGRAAAHPQRRALDHPEGHEHRRAPDLSPTAAISTGCATTTSSAATAPATASTSSRKRSSRSTFRTRRRTPFYLSPLAGRGRRAKRVG